MAQKYCTKCGTPLTEDMDTCPNCGAVIQYNRVYKTQQTKEDSNKPKGKETKRSKKESLSMSPETSKILKVASFSLPIAMLVFNAVSIIFGAVMSYHDTFSFFGLMSKDYERFSSFAVLIVVLLIALALLSVVQIFLYIKKIKALPKIVLGGISLCCSIAIPVITLSNYEQNNEANGVIPFAVASILVALLTALFFSALIIQKPQKNNDVE